LLLRNLSDEYPEPCSDDDEDDEELNKKRDLAYIKFSMKYTNEFGVILFSKIYI
jgi:hypothetical protein